jgi:hypothetical protein
VFDQKQYTRTWFGGSLRATYTREGVDKEIQAQPDLNVDVGRRANKENDTERGKG